MDKNFEVGDIIGFSDSNENEYEIICLYYENGCVPKADLTHLTRRGDGPTYRMNGLENAHIIRKGKNKKMSDTSIAARIKLLTKQEPDKSHIKAGIRTVNDEFTPEGLASFQEYLYQKNKDDFKTEVADKIIEENEANAK